MHKRTFISSIILVLFLIILVGFSLFAQNPGGDRFSHWTIPSTIALIMTLLIGLILMDDIFELDRPFTFTLKKALLKVEIQKYLVWSFAMVAFAAIVLETVQLILSHHNTSFIDPLAAMGGSLAGIVIHIIGSSLLMKRVEFELERWEDNVL